MWTIFIDHPFAALMFSALFGVLYVLFRKVAAGTAALIWVGYATYEYLMQIRVLCTGECNIRVDLLLIYPLLLSVSAWAVLSSLWRSRG